MFTSILQLSRHTLIYGVGNVVTRMIPFLLLPALTNILPPDQFGAQILYYVFIAVMMEIVRLGLDVALIRFYIPEQDVEQRKIIFSSIFWGALVFTSILSTILWFGAEFWTKLIISSPDFGNPENAGAYTGWMFYTLKLCAIIIWLDNVNAFPLVAMRGENKPGMFLFARISGVVVQTAMTLVLLISFDRGIPGIFEANVLASLTTLLICVPTIFTRLRFVFDKTVALSCLAFGLPNVPNVLFVQVIELSDRKILEIFRTPEEVGIYSAGYKLGTFFAIVAMGFRLAWQPFFMQIKDKPDAKLIFGRVLTYYLGVVFWMFLVLNAFLEPLTKWTIPGVERSFIPPGYWEGIQVFPIVAFAHVFNGMFAVFMVGIYIEKKMKVLPWITGIAAVVNIGGNLLLVPVFGMWASAWLTVGSYAIMAVLLYVYVQKHYRIPYEWGRVMHQFIVAGILFAVIAVTQNAGYIFPGLIAAILYPAMLYFTGFMTDGEKGRINSFFHIS